MLSVPAPWLAELNDEVALVTDPDGRTAVLSAMAYAALRRGDVGDGDLVDMLELAWVDSRHWLPCASAPLAVVCTRRLKRPPHARSAPIAW
ncbi:hypothetical protein FGL97_00995 [Pseudomonas putida]|nr:hypothetical protein [Pseudomonas putida]NVN66826.1 hypothetical protein [Pseudomonas putida]